MPLYRYKALTATGKKVGGMIDADSYSLAKEKLRRDRVLLTKLEAVKSGKEIALTPTLLLGFTRELAQLLKAGLPLYECFLTLEEKNRTARSHPLYIDICDKLKSGCLLSAILKCYPRTFDSIYLAMIRAGEETGALSWAFDQLFELTERRQKLKKQLIQALSYPMFLGGFCFCITTALLLFVIPTMGELFEGRALHPLTQTIVNTSGFVRHHGFLLSLSLLGFSALAVTSWTHPSGKHVWHQLFQRMPLIRTILTEAALIRFCKSASLLLKGGVPLMPALSTARQLMRHALMEDAIAQAEKKIGEGQTLSRELQKCSAIPALVPRMLSIAEETGRMSDMLENLATIYDQELEKSLSVITTFLQPALLILLGGIVGLVILAILLPLTDVSSLMT